MRVFSVCCALLLLVAGVHAEESVADSLTELRCTAAQQVLPDAAELQDRLVRHQILSEEVLSLRARAVDFLYSLQEKEARKEALSGGDLRRLNQGAAAMLALRDRLLQVVNDHECWLDLPLPEDAQQARIQASGIALGLSSALMLYDNYLSAVGLYRAIPSLRQHLNSRDQGFALPSGELTRMAMSFNSALNRARTQRAVSWYERHGQFLALSENDAERYVVQLIEQSPAYQMVRRFRPLGYVGRQLGFFSVFTLDTLNKLKKEGVNLSSLFFGNAVGLVELRRGKLDGDADALHKLTQQVRAGDVLLEKTPFRLTDSFIPGHYGHVAVWVGDETELRALGLWEHPVVQPHQDSIRAGRGVVEALRSGVKMNTLRQFMNIDDLALMRPRDINDTQRAEVILQTLRQVGKAYDFNFDVETTDRIVCSELVYHAYGDVRWPLQRQLGRVTISPDNVAAQAIPGGKFKVALLYRDGQEITEQPEEVISRLLQPRALQLVENQVSSDD